MFGLEEGEGEESEITVKEGMSVQERIDRLCQSMGLIRTGRSAQEIWKGMSRSLEAGGMRVSQRGGRSMISPGRRGSSKPSAVSGQPLASDIAYGRSEPRASAVSGQPLASDTERPEGGGESESGRPLASDGALTTDDGARVEFGQPLASNLDPPPPTVETRVGASPVGRWPRMTRPPRAMGCVSSSVGRWPRTSMPPGKKRSFPRLGSWRCTGARLCATA